MDTIIAIKKALEAAEQFIVNGVELGYIRMPDPRTPDSAHDTLPMIQQAQTALESLQRENEELRKGKDHIAAEKAGIAKNAHSNVDYWKSKYEAAEAEVKRYREALHIISAGPPPSWRGSHERYIHASD